MRKFKMFRIAVRKKNKNDWLTVTLNQKLATMVSAFKGRVDHIDQLFHWCETLDQLEYFYYQSFKIDYSKTFYVFIVDFFTIYWVVLRWVIRSKAWSLWSILYYCKLYGICFFDISFCFLWSCIIKLLCVFKTHPLNQFRDVKCRLRFSFWFFDSCYVLCSNVCFFDSPFIFYRIHGTRSTSS